MKVEQHPVVGNWNVVRSEIRISGEWLDDEVFEHGEWFVQFLANGNFYERFSPRETPPVAEEKRWGRWFLDVNTSVIAIFAGEPEVRYHKLCVFSGDGEAFLYIFRDAPHIRPEHRLIIEHHAHERWRMVKAG